MVHAIKRYDDIPAGHRAPHHDGHCRYVHGHNYSFEFVFNAHHRDANGFVVDFGKLEQIKNYLKETYDHKLLIAKDDPYVGFFENMNLLGLCDLRVVDNTSAEGMAESVYEYVSELLKLAYGTRVWVASVRVYEDSRNSAIFSR